MKNISTNSKLKYLLTFIFIIWILLAMVRTGYNFTKIYTEELSWLSLSSNEKKERLFGDLYIFLTNIDESTPKTNTITIITDDPRMYYFNKYILYPRKAEVIEVNKNGINSKNNLKKTVAIFLNTEKSISQIKLELEKRGYILTQKIVTNNSFAEIYNKYD